MAIFQGLMGGIFKSTHNKVIGQLTLPLLNLRTWAEYATDIPETIASTETAFINHLISAIESRDPEHARANVATATTIPPPAAPRDAAST